MRLPGPAGIFRQHVPPEVYQENARFDVPLFSIVVKGHALLSAGEIDLGQLNLR